MKAVAVVPASIVLTLAALFASLAPPAAAQTPAEGKLVAFKGKSSGVVAGTGFLQPTSTVTLDTAEDAKKVLRLIDALDDLDDVSEVYANFDIPDPILQTLEA